MQAVAFNAICFLLQLWMVSITFFGSVPAWGSCDCGCGCVRQREEDARLGRSRYTPSGATDRKKEK